MVYLALEVLHAGHRRHLRLSAGPDRRDDSLEPPVGGIVDDPSAILVLVYLIDLCVELGLRVQTVVLPEMSDLTDDLLAVRISTLPLHGWVEAIHERVNLETRRVVHSLYW